MAPRSDHHTVLAEIATHVLAFEGETRVTFFARTFSECEEWRGMQLSEAALRAHRITSREPPT